ncbi:MAG TPA: tetratricopeptide repeat protein, partial [Gemmataceae bacterium]|nr:tetratricopeptide repeat protein [Gemmataceae bacterium]
LVKGTPITEYCDQHRLTTRQRLALFRHVCQAVQHAHQKGIIHRDLKPSNVLVSLHDTTPIVKVIDFGIAKATGGRLTEHTVYTAFAQMLGTPLYMSPEQAGLSDLDVDTRSDLYSLGVLLYELLTGMTPFDSETLNKAGYDEMRRIIREDEPPRPSGRLSTLAQAHLSTIAERRGLEPRRLSQQLRGELDWIVMKALEKDRNRRYESASALAVDVHRYLHDEPVLACPPSQLYRLRKFTRRHKAGLGVAGCVLLVLVLGGVVMWREHGQRAAAAASVEAALVRAEELREQERWQETDALLAVAQGQVEGRGLASLRRRVEQARREVEMLTSIEEAGLQRSAGTKDKMFDYAGADRLYAQAFQRYGIDVATLEPQDASRRIRASVIRHRLVEALDDWAFNRDRNSDAEGGKALRTLARLTDDDRWSQRLREATARADRMAFEIIAQQEDTLQKRPVSLVLLAHSLESAKSGTRAVALLRQAQMVHPESFWLNYELAVALSGQKPPAPVQAARFCQAALALRPQSPVVHNELGAILLKQHKAAEAEAAFRKAIALKHDSYYAYTNLSVALGMQGKLLEAEAACRKSLALWPDGKVDYLNLGSILREQGKLAEAEEAYRKCIALEPNDAAAYTNLSNALNDEGKLPEAEAALRKAIQLRPDDALAHSNLSHVLEQEGRLAEAEAASRRAIRLEPRLALAQLNLGLVLCNQGKLGEAEAAYRKAIALEPDLAEAHYTLGRLLGARSKLAKAEAAYRQAIALKPNFAEAYVNLAEVLLGMGKLAEAEAACRKAIVLKPNLVQAHGNLGAALDRQGRLAEGKVAYRKVIALKPDDARAHCNLGLLLEREGRFAEALGELRRGHALGSKDPAGWPYPSGQWISECERAAALDRKLPRLLKGEIKPADAAERLALAGLCQSDSKQLYAAAARWYAEAFAAEPQLAGSPRSGTRYNAACAAALAALAGCGRGRDAGGPDPTARGRLRRQALTWLRSDLQGWQQLLKHGSAQAGAMVAQQMQHWLGDADFSGVRGASALAKLPALERQAWEQLWAEVRNTLVRSHEQVTSQKKPDMK